jgi:hypothetical protein
MKNLSTRALKYAIVFFMLLGTYAGKAQYVTLPDTVFAAWLQNN